MQAGKIIREAVDKTMQFGRKIGSNLSVDGGIKGLQTDLLTKQYRSLDDAYKVATDAFEKGRGKVGKEAMEDLLRNKNKAYSRKISLEDDLTSGISSMDAHAKELSRMGYGDSTIGLQMGKGLAKEYFTGGSRGQNATRIGAAAGAYMGVNVAGRKLSGGSVGYNNKGERDIAGIPML